MRWSEKPTMQRTSNPFMGSLAKNSQPYAMQTPPTYGNSYGQYSGSNTTNAYANYGQAQVSDRPLTVDDIVTKTGITLAVIIATAIVNFFLSQYNLGLGIVLTCVGAIGALVTVMISAFSRNYGSAALTLTYAVFEGLMVGGFSYVVAGIGSNSIDAGSLIGQAVLGTIGVFVGMLFVYKTGAIRVTPKFTRFMVGALIGVMVLALGNLVFALFTGSAGILRDGGPIAIIFSLICIGLAAFSFLLDFDQADRMVRAGVPSKMAWGIAMGLAVTLVWLYTEILRFLSYFRD